VNAITDKILRNAILSGIFLLPFICLIVFDQFFFPFITGKNFAFRIIVEIITALWLILALRDSSALPKFSRIFQAFAVFLVFIFISDLLSPNVYKSFWSNYERMEGWVTLAHLFALFVVTSSIMTKKLWDWLFRASLGVSLILFVYGLLQINGSYPIHQGSTRIDTTIGNSAYLGGYMLFHVFLAFYLLLDYFRNRRHNDAGWEIFWPIFYGFAIIADLFILFTTATRGAEIGVVIGLFIFAIGLAIFEKEHKILRRVGMAFLIIIILLGSLFVMGRKSDFVKSHEAFARLAPLVDELLTFDKDAICSGQFKSRCLLWPVALEGVKDRPIFGWGQESFNYVFNEHYDPRMYSQEQWFDRAHNLFFDWLIAGGILGLLSFLSLYGFSFYYLWRKRSPFSFSERSLFTGLFVGYFFYNLTVFDNITSYILFIFVLAWINSVVGTVPETFGKKISALDYGTKNRILIPLISVLMIFVLYKVNVPAMLASSELISAMSSLPQGPSANLAHYKKAISYSSFGDSEIHEQLVQASVKSAGMESVDLKIKGEFFELARVQMEKQLERTPKDARYYLFAGTLFSSFGYLDDAVKYLTTAHELSPKKQTILFSLGSAYLSKGDYGKASEIMKEAFDLDRTYSEARQLYGLVLVYAKQVNKSDEVLKPLKSELILGDPRFIQAYFASGYFNKALESINFLLKKEPGNAQYYFSRAAIEYKMGRVSAAIADLNKAAEVNPAAKSQVEKLIDQIRLGKAI
jgi:O-antigen ligase/Flp pilus assembly protein TadD